MISVSGSAIVFRREITRLAWTPPAVTPTGPLMTVEELSAAAKKAYPRFESFRVAFSNDPARAAVVTMTRGQRTRERAFDPYTGKDLGDVGTDEPKLLSWLVRLHDDLLAGQTGRLVNGAGALLFTILCLTGAVIWWPGIARWWRSLFVWRKAGWKRFNWDLHSALGFWMFLFVLMWGISGIYLSYAEPFMNLVDYLQPLDPDSLDAAIRRRVPGLARAGPLRARVRHLGQVAVRGAGTRAGGLVRHRRDHVVEPRAAAGAAEERTAARWKPRAGRLRVSSRRTSRSRLEHARADDSHGLVRNADDPFSVALVVAAVCTARSPRRITRDSTARRTSTRALASTTPSAPSATARTAT